MVNRFLPLRLVTLLASAWLAPVAHGAESKRLIRPHDLWAMKRQGSPALSPEITQ
jgi:hypothetical protein